MPFVIRLIDRTQEDCELQEVSIKIKPGSKNTGVAVVREEDGRANVLALFTLVHRGRQISEALTARSNLRRRRRGKLRYRAQRFYNRTKPKGWLAPSLQHRVDTTCAWVKRIRSWAPVTAVAQELLRFDTQKMQNPEISGIEYQQGTLFGYEVREYLLEKWRRQCAYCDAKNTPLQIDHIEPKARGGSDRISNLTLACVQCNQKKAAQQVETFLSKDARRLARIKAQAKAPLRDPGAINATRWALANTLKKTGLPLELSSGGRTKFNRTRLGIPKTHTLDAACVGNLTSIENWQRPTLQIKCTGRGSYKRTRLDKYGFPRGYLMRSKSAFGFQTGDLVKATVPKGKNTGAHMGRVAIRATGSFDIQTVQGKVGSVSHRYCKVIQRGDGYGYAMQSIDSN